MKEFLYVIGIMVGIGIIFTCICLIKYLRFDKRIKEANQKQNEKGDFKSLIKDIRKWETKEGNELQRKEWNEKDID